MPFLRLLPAILVLANAPILAQDDNPFADNDPMFGEASGDSTSQLLSDATAIAPGQPFTLSLKLTHPAGWHSYYHNDGIGISEIPVLKWTLPEGFTAGELQWPIPHLAAFIGMTSYAYLDTNYFSTTITPPAGLAPGTEVAIGLKATWQICEEGCKSEQAEFTLTLPVKAAAEADQAVTDALRQYAQTHMPAPTPPGWQVFAADDGQQITLRITTGEALPEDLFFFDYDGQIAPQHVQKFTSPEPGVWELVAPRNTGNDISEKHGPVLNRLKGILAGHDALPGTDRPGAWIEIVFDGKSDAAADSPSTAVDGTPPANAPNGDTITLEGGAERTFTFWSVLPFAFLGGLILNLMPCVFPVLGIKIMGFVQQAGEDKSKVKVHGMVFTAGVVVSMLILAAILIALNAAGEQNGWGFQLQSPPFLAAILILFFAFGLNLSGLFEIGTSLTGSAVSCSKRRATRGPSSPASSRPSSPPPARAPSSDRSWASPSTSPPSTPSRSSRSSPWASPPRISSCRSSPTSSRSSRVPEPGWSPSRSSWPSRCSPRSSSS